MSAPVAFEHLISDFELESTFTYKEGLAWERPKILARFSFTAPVFSSSEMPSYLLSAHTKTVLWWLP